jgi:hypothetical protein
MYLPITGFATPNPWGGGNSAAQRQADARAGSSSQRLAFATCANDVKASRQTGNWQPATIHCDVKHTWH